MTSYLNLYDQIKALEPVFTVPANYVTIDVGTLDASSGIFTGLKSHVERDPEPVAHSAGQHPTSPEPHYQGNLWVSVTVDNTWHRTITTIPAPQVGLVPVLLKFSVKNHQNASWSVNVSGRSVGVPAGQSSVSVNIWDSRVVDWSISCSGKDYSDRIMIQRPADPIVGLGAFTVPALPLSIVYAPPADSAGLSKTSYSVTQVVGTTSSFQLTSGSSTTQPWLPQDLASLSTLQTLLSGLSGALSNIQNPYAQAIGAACGAISSGIGTMSGSAAAGIVSSDRRTVTLTESQTQAIYAEAANGGPGEGDAIYYLRDAKFAWLMSGGCLQICLLGGVYASYPARYLEQHAADPQTTGLPTDVVNLLLAMDPFVAGGPTAALATPRYKDLNTELQGPREYGGGATVTGSHQQSFSVSDARSSTTYTTNVSDYNPGWLGKVFGSTAQTLKSTVSVTRAAGTTHTESQTYTWELHSGPAEHFIVEFWLDQVFGTLALRQEALADRPRLHGIARTLNGRPLVRQPVKLTIGGRTYLTVTGSTGEYAFYSQAIPEGKASLIVGNEPAQSAVVAKRVVRPRDPG